MIATSNERLLLDLGNYVILKIKQYCLIVNKPSSNLYIVDYIDINRTDVIYQCSINEEKLSRILQSEDYLVKITDNGKDLYLNLELQYERYGISGKAIIADDFEIDFGYNGYGEDRQRVLELKLYYTSIKDPEDPDVYFIPINAETLSIIYSDDKYYMIREIIDEDIKLLFEIFNSVPDEIKMLMMLR